MRRHRRVSLVMPVLNEASRIEQRLRELARLNLEEAVLVDGGSEDATLERAQAFVQTHPEAPVHLLSCERGRARQMNHGAQHARGDVLWFVHADVELAGGELDWIETLLRDPECVAGAFRIRTTDDVPAGDSFKRRFWRRTLLLADLRSHYSRVPYGDQGIFVRREVFEQLGGYRDLPLMEDLDLSQRLRGLGRVRIAPHALRVSGRRFMHAPLRYAALINAFPLLYRLGVSAERLKRLYHDVR